MSDLAAPKLNILLAAATVSTRHGASHLTLERVAKEAGLSKGGLLYHYPNKQALLEGMLTHVVSRTRKRLDAQQQAQTATQRPIAASFVHAEAHQDASERAMAQAILAVAAENPKLLEPARELLQEWLGLARAEGDLSVALTLASEGLRFLTTLELIPPDGPLRDALLESLTNLAEQGR